MSEEFNKMTKKEMAQLMLDGHKLEVVCGNGEYHFTYFEENESNQSPFVVEVSGHRKDTNEQFWNLPCRIYKPKVKKWQWLYIEDKSAEVTDHYATKEEAERDFGCKMLRKIEETEIEE